MAKPWARLEHNYINHPKFLALSPAAICLWHEGKNYCDMHHTDGLIPRDALKTFRFATRSVVDALTTSAGDKPDGSRWMPLWERIGSVGFKMHDYLQYNDCRDAVLARIEQGDREKAADRQRKADARAAKKAKASAKSPENVRSDFSPDTSRTVREMSRSTTEVEITTERRKAEDPPPTTARSRRPIFQGQRVVVFEWMLDDCRNLLGPHLDTFDIDEWFFTLDAQCVTDGVIPPDRDNGKWLKAELLAEAQRRGLPLRIAGTGPSATDVDRVREILKAQGAL